INISADGMYGNPYGTLAMGLNMMNPYSYIPPNLPPSMLTSYLQRMGYPSSVEPELLLMSQMSQMYTYNQPSASAAAYNPLNAMFNASPGGSSNTLYNTTSANSSYYKSLPSITTSSPTNYTNSSAFNGGISPITSSTSAQYNLGRYLPSFAALTGSSNSVSPSASSRLSSSPIASAFPFNLYGSSSATPGVQPLATNQPGPNAIKNPLLSNLLPPSNPNPKDYQSIPTSVITKAAKDAQRATNTSVGNTGTVSLNASAVHVSRSGTAATSNVVNIMNHQGSTHSNHSNSSLSKTMAIPKGSPLTVARASPLSSARGSPSTVARISPSSARNSPSTSVNFIQPTRSSPSESRSIVSTSRSALESTNSLSITRTTPSMQKTSQLPLSITLTGNRTSPEPNIIVKDVNAINRTVERKGVPSSSSKTSTAQPIKNFNMGIVYPKAPEKKAFDLSQNDQILNAARNQLNQLNTSRLNNSMQNNSGKSGISLTHQPNRTANRQVITTKGPNLPTNEVTITPTTKRIQVSQRGTLPISAVNAHKSTVTTTQKTPIELKKLSSALS
ncbi:hypothetical protein Bhyg_17754, partial [Pseudolycoriella hygida]